MYLLPSFLTSTAELSDLQVAWEWKHTQKHTASESGTTWWMLAKSSSWESHENHGQMFVKLEYAVYLVMYFNFKG